LLKLCGILNKALVVKRLKVNEEYIVVWPEEFSDAFKLQNIAQHRIMVNT
jgi:hypothetical protein